MIALRPLPQMAGPPFWLLVAAALAFLFCLAVLIGRDA